MTARARTKATAKPSAPAARARAPARPKPASAALVPQVQAALDSPGQALEPGTRAAMEARFGHDFGQVRVHTDGTAAEAAKGLQSLAFTHGQDIVFAAGQYSPRTPAGMRLLAHELTHTVQQRGAPRTVQGFSEVSRPGAPLEREAESVASRVAEGGAVAPRALSVGAVGTRGLIARRVDPAVGAASEQVALDSMRIIETLVRVILLSLQADPSDSYGRVRRQLEPLSPSVRDAVVAQLRRRVAPGRLEALLATVDPAEEAPASREAAEAEAELERARMGTVEAAQARAGAAPTAAAEPTAELVPDEAPSTEEAKSREAGGRATRGRERLAAPGVALTEGAAPDEARAEAGVAPPQEAPPRQMAQVEDSAAQAAEQGTAQAQATGLAVLTAMGAAGGVAAAGGNAAPAGGGAAPAIEATPAGSGVAPAVEATPAGGGAAPAVEAIPAGGDAAPAVEATPAGGGAAPAVEATSIGGAVPAVEATSMGGAEPAGGTAAVSGEAVSTAGGAREEAHPERAGEDLDSPEATATEEKMDAARPEEEAAAEALQEGEAEPEVEGAAETEPEPLPPSGGVEGGSAPTLEPAEAGAAERAEDSEERQAREVEQAPFAEASSSPESAPAEDAALSPGEQQAAMASLQEGAAAGGGGEAGGGGGGGGGGAIAERAAPEVPDVSRAEPAEALGMVAHLPPAQLSQALAGVGQAVSRSVGGKRDELASHPPELEKPTGMTARPRELSARPAPVQGAAPRRPDRVVAGESAPVPRPEPTPEPARAPVAIPTPILRGGEQGEMAPGDAARLGASIQNLPTGDPELSTRAGPAPVLSLEGGADPGTLDAQRANVEERISEARVQGQTEVAQPMGEDEIAPEAVEGTLKAEVAMGGGAGAGGASGGEVDEAVSIVAQQEHGGEIQAAVQAGQGDMAEEEARHAEAEEQGWRKTQEEAEQQSQATAEAQRAEKQAAGAEVEAQREQWSEAQRTAVERGRTEADSKQEASRARVRQEKERADTAAGEHLESGEREAARHKREGEAEAARQKARAKSESGGFLGWVAARATAFFNSIKEGIRAAIQKAREAVKRAIDMARRLAREAIEKARQVVVAVIREAGEALIAVGDTVLAAFPEARARFRQNIEDKVRAAEAVVNQLAEELQAGVQKLLDGLGELLDKALGLLEQGLLFIVDSLNTVVQGAIKAAKAALEALGAFAQLIRDIAANPGQWLANLGAAVVDGIRNHLWKALKGAVAQWFDQKLEAVLGLGTALLNLLVKGGLSLAAIGRMAWEALKAAIPTALVQLLIEKLVSMIVPAAGAVLAIIEGLQAAWGTVSRILQAMDRFIAFLKAVKSGGAGPQFANAVAAGAVAVIEFVANWLLARLRKPAGAVAGRLRAIGRKILAKLKRALKKVGKALKKAWRKLEARFKRLFKRKGRKGQPSKDKKKALNEKIQRVQRDLPPKLHRLMSRKPSRLRFKAQLLAWRVAYRLRRLEVVGGMERFRIVATVNPNIELAPGWSFEEMDVIRVADKLAGEFLEEAQAEQAKHAQAPGQTSAEAGSGGGKINLREFESPAAPLAALAPQSAFIVGATQASAPVGYQHGKEVAPFGGWWGWQGIAGLEGNKGRRYQDIAAKLSGLPVGNILTALLRKQRPELTREQASDVGELFGLWFAKEPSHNLGRHQRDLVYSFMATELMSSRQGAQPLSIEQGVALHPASFGKAQMGARAVTEEMLGVSKGLPKDEKAKVAREERLTRERNTLLAWFKRHASEIPVFDRKPTLNDVEDFVRAKLRDYLKKTR